MHYTWENGISTCGYNKTFIIKKKRVKIHQGEKTKNSRRFLFFGNSSSVFNHHNLCAQRHEFCRRLQARTYATNARTRVKCCVLKKQKGRRRARERSTVHSALTLKKRGKIRCTPATIASLWWGRRVIIRRLCTHARCFRQDGNCAFTYVHLHVNIAMNNSRSSS